MSFKFKGGIRPDDHKYTASSPVKRIPETEFVSVPLTQHVGVMCRPVVKVGDRVLRGQLVGEIPGGLGCPVHSGVSGTVRRIEEFTTETGGASYNIVIENDMEHTLAPTVRPFGKKLSEATTEEIVSVIRNAGITGMGGTSFPTHARISAARGKVDKIIVNCLETEPFSCSTHRLVVENATEIIGGVKILMVALGVRHAVVAVGENEKEELRALDTVLGGSDIITLRKVQARYPADSERYLIYSLTGMAVPSGVSPMESGCIVFSADTLYAVYEAFAKGLPLCERIVTVDGDCVAEPANWLVPVGTPASHLINCSGGLCRELKKIVFGGPLSGNAVWDENSPVTKNTRAVLALSSFFDRESKKDAPVCLHCGRCVDACPMGLVPIKIAEAYRRGAVGSCQLLYAEACTGCGCCSYVCPGGVSVSQIVSAAKHSVIEKRRKAVSD